MSGLTATVDPVETTFTVAELARAVGRAVARAFGDEVWVEGEIRDLKRPSHSGHVYFTLADPGAPDMLLPVSLFAGDRQAVNRVLVRSGAMRMTDGVHVRIRGQVVYHGARSTVRLRMTWIDTDYTLGRLAAERHALLRSLAERDLLGRNAMRPVPPLPVRVGLVTSVGSAAHADFLSELERSGFGFEVGVAHAAVQGGEAPVGIAVALAALAPWRPDIVAVVRGGGAQTDLAAFDTETVALAIARAPFPVLVGIGHEIDATVSDEVAAMSLKTPTACAAAIVDLVDGFRVRVAAAADHLERTAASGLRVAGTALDHRSVRLRLAGLRFLADMDKEVARCGVRLSRHGLAAARAAEQELVRRAERTAGAMRRRLDVAEAGLDDRLQSLIRRVPRRIKEAERRLDGVETIVRTHHPQRMLGRGWSLTRRSDGRLVRRPDEVQVGEALVTTTGGGLLHSEVVPGPGDAKDTEEEASRDGR